ncbi:MAG: hypothetical protein ACYDCQ_14980, partial [Dehalococcoidia bacterium]
MLRARLNVTVAAAVTGCVDVGTGLGRLGTALPCILLIAFAGCGRAAGGGTGSSGTTHPVLVALAASDG